MRANFVVDTLYISNGDYAGQNYNNHAFDGVFDGHECIAMIINDQVLYIPKSDLGIKNISELYSIGTDDVVNLSINISQELKAAMIEASNCFRLNNGHDVTCRYDNGDYKIELD